MRRRLVASFSLAAALLASGSVHAADLAVVGAKIYRSPTEPAIDNGSIVVHDGRI